MEWLPTFAVIVSGLLTIIAICALILTVTCVRMATLLETAPRREASASPDDRRASGKVIGRIGPEGRR